MAERSRGRMEEETDEERGDKVKVKKKVEEY